MENYDVMPSASRQYRTFAINSEFVEDEKTSRTIRSICRKHGVCFMVVKSGVSFSYLFFIPFDRGEILSVDSQYDKQMHDCFNELDIRTGLFFPSMRTSYGKSVGYVLPVYRKYREIMAFDAIDKFIVGNIGADDEYLFFSCNARKVPIENEELLSGITGKIHLDLQTFFDNQGFDTVVRQSATSRKELCGVLNPDKISMARKFAIVFGKTPSCDNCSVYVMQMKDGTFGYVLIDSDKKGHFASDTEHYFPGNMQALLLSYISENRKRN